MTKKGKKRSFDETKSISEQNNAKNKEEADNNSPKKKKKLSSHLPNKKEKFTNLLKDSQESNLSPQELKKKKNKKHKKLDEPDVSQSGSKKKMKKHKKHKKNNSECTNKSIKKLEKMDAMESKEHSTTIEPKKKHEETVIAEINKQNTESMSKSKKKKKDKKHKKHKETDKSVEKLDSNSEKSDKKSESTGRKVISSKRKTKFKLKREEFRKQRKLIRQEEGQFSSINKLSLEEMKQKIAEIESREKLSNSAIRKLRTLKKKVQVEEGNVDDTKTKKRKSDHLHEYKKDHKNKKIKSEELLNDTKKNIDTALKNKMENSPKKSKNVECNLSKQMTKKQLFIEDRIGSTANENNPEKQQIKQLDKKCIAENEKVIDSPKKKIDSPPKKHETSEAINSKIDTLKSYTNLKKQFNPEFNEDNSNSNANLNNQQNVRDEECIKKSDGFVNKYEISVKNKKMKIGNLDFDDGLYKDSNGIEDSNSNLIKNACKKKLEIKNHKSSELKKRHKNKLKSELILNLDKEEGELDESDSIGDHNDESDQITLRKEIQINNKESPKTLEYQKNYRKKFEQKMSDAEEGELEESDSENNYCRTEKISPKKEIKIDNKESLKSLNPKKYNKGEQKIFDLEEDKSREYNLEESDSKNSNYSESDEISLENELVINDEESPQSLKNQKKKKKKFEQKAEKEEGELEESGSGNELKSKSDKISSNYQVEQSLKQIHNQNHVNENSAKKQRYVLFLGNLAYETTAVDLKKHFLTKVTKVKDVRIPLDSKTRKPRGFGYIEVENSEDYEKALSLHGTFVKGRPIKIQYTASGSKKAGNRKEIIHKNKKLHALRKAGKLAGSKKDSHKRSFRRNLKKDTTQK